MALNLVDVSDSLFVCSGTGEREEVPEQVAGVAGCLLKIEGGSGGYPRMRPGGGN